MGVDLKYFVSHIQALHRMSTLQQMLNNQCDKIIQPVDISQPLSLATPVLAQWAHERYSCGGRNGALNGSSSMSFLLPKMI